MSLRIDLHLHVHQDGQSDTAAKLDSILALLGGIKAQEDTMTKELTDLVAQVAASTQVEQSAVTLIQGLADQIAAAKDDPAQIAKLSADLKAGTDALAAAITANTPAAPPVPAPATP